MELGMLIVYPVAIKFVLSAIKYGFSELSSDFFKIASMVLGLGCGFLVADNALLVPATHTGQLPNTIGHLVTGLIFGASAMGAHDLSQMVTPKSKTPSA